MGWFLLLQQIITSLMDSTREIYYLVVCRAVCHWAKFSGLKALCSFLELWVNLFFFPCWVLEAAPFPCLSLLPPSSKTVSNAGLIISHFTSGGFSFLIYFFLFFILKKLVITLGLLDNPKSYYYLRVSWLTILSSHLQSLSPFAI